MKTKNNDLQELKEFILSYVERSSVTEKDPFGYYSRAARKEDITKAVDEKLNYLPRELREKVPDTIVQLVEEDELRYSRQGDFYIRPIIIKSVPTISQLMVGGCPSNAVGFAQRAFRTK